MKLTQKEFNKRCNEVFESREGDKYYFVDEVFSDDRVVITMSETDKDGYELIFNYEANMVERPEALAYILGQRDDFND